MTLFTLRGTAFRLHPAGGALMLLYALCGQAATLAAAMSALALHEAGHLAAARALGVRVRSVELLPCGGAARMEELEEEPSGRQALAALAGPAISGAAFLLMTAAWARGYGARCPVYADAARFHFLLGAFNLLPALPLDGGWAACALLGGRLGRRRVARLFGTAGVMLGAGLLLLSVYAALRGTVNLGLAFMGCYLVYAARDARRSAAMRCADAAVVRQTLLARRGAMPVRILAVSDALRVESLAERLSPGCVHRIWVMRAGEDAPARVLTDAEYARGLLANPHDTIANVFLRG